MCMVGYVCVCVCLYTCVYQGVGGIKNAPLAIWNYLQIQFLHSEMLDWPGMFQNLAPSILNDEVTHFAMSSESIML